MSDKNRKIVIVLVTVVLFILTVCIGIYLIELGKLQGIKRDIEYCQQFKIVPEKYINKIPSMCVPEYFKGSK